MYSKESTLTYPSGNNAFSYKIREKKSLHIPSLINGNFDDITIGEKVVFSDIDESGILQECIGLKHFIKTSWKNIPVIIFDNHNHAFYFWYEARKNGIIQNNATLIHIDEHSDLGIPEDFSFDKENLKDVFRYTNEILQV
jgi:hypothetical protein